MSSLSHKLYIQEISLKFVHNCLSYPAAWAAPGIWSWGRATWGQGSGHRGQGKLVWADKMSTLFSRCVHQKHVMYREECNIVTVTVAAVPVPSYVHYCVIKPEMIRSVLLSKSTSGNHADSSFFKKLAAVHGVRFRTISLTKRNTNLIIDC